MFLAFQNFDALIFDFTERYKWWTMAEVIVRYLQAAGDYRGHYEIVDSLFWEYTADVKKLGVKGETLIVKEFTSSQGICDFTECLRAIQGHPNLFNTSKEVFRMIINDIATHQEDYSCSHPSMDGYIIHRENIVMVYLRRKGSVGRGQMGCMNYDKLLQRALDYFYPPKKKDKQTKRKNKTGKSKHQKQNVTANQQGDQMQSEGAEDGSSDDSEEEKEGGDDKGEVKAREEEHKKKEQQQQQKKKKKKERPPPPPVLGTKREAT